VLFWETSMNRLFVKLPPHVMVTCCAQIGVDAFGYGSMLLLWLNMADAGPNASPNRWLPLLAGAHTLFLVVVLSVSGLRTRNNAFSKVDSSLATLYRLQGLFEGVLLLEMCRMVGKQFKVRCTAVGWRMRVLWVSVQPEIVRRHVSRLTGSGRWEARCALNSL
jgi:hypothetical protein